MRLYALQGAAPCKLLGSRRRRGVPRLLLSRREAARTISRMQMHSVRQQTTLRPNQSVKRTRSGMPPGPGWRYAVHFRHPGPGIIPLRSAYLQR